MQAIKTYFLEAKASTQLDDDPRGPRQVADGEDVKAEGKKEDEQEEGKIVEVKNEDSKMQSPSAKKGIIGTSWIEPASPDGNGQSPSRMLGKVQKSQGIILF